MVRGEPAMCMTTTPGCRSPTTRLHLRTSKPGDVVDDLCTGFHGGDRHGGLGCVYGNDHPPSTQSLDDRDHPAEFLLERHVDRPRPG